jgi:beta-lactamase superfamily II metal-dependent hydrolase
VSDQRILKIDVVLISHADEDHIGGLIGILASDSIDVGIVRLNTDSLQGSAIWDDLLYELDHAVNKGKIDFRPSLTSSDSGAFDRGDVSIEILGPSPYLAARGPGQLYGGSSGPRLSTNSVSAVIRISNDGRPVALLPGDLDDIGFDDLMSHGVDVRAPVLVFPHHGGLVGKGIDIDSFVTKLCTAVKPSTVLFSIGRGGTYRTPRPEVVAAVRACSSEVRIACTQLSTQCASSLPKANPSHLNDIFAKGREHRKCCAGSLVIELDGKNPLFPLNSDHQAFIISEAPTALCRKGS